MVSRDISKGTVFWREPQNQAVDTSGKGHHWVELVGPVMEGGRELVLWVPLSSFKKWLNPNETYVFNVGKFNKYTDARYDSCPMLKFAEVTTVRDIETENPKRHNRIRTRDVDGICEVLARSKDTTAAAKRFFADHGTPRAKRVG